jgi:hypothetical protein
MFLRQAALSLLLSPLLLAGQIVGAANAPFKDVPAGTALAEAVVFLKANNIIAGYADGTFRPDNGVNRAEALKIIIAPLVKQEALAQIKQTPFNDITADAWYLPYVEAARQNGVVDGPPKKDAFHGTDPVLKVEFLKMLMLAFKEDPNSYSEIVLPVASDVKDTSVWYYPYMRYALSSSMTMISTDGLLTPQKKLTRGETSLLLYRFLMYRAGRRTQALLSEAETEIIIVLGSMQDQNIEQAEYASARALLAARGAHARQPDQPIVQGALKISESFRSIVRAYRAGSSKLYDDAIALCKESWQQAERARELSSGLDNLATQVQTLAGKMAESARQAKAATAS